MADYFGDNQAFATTSNGLPGVSRSFTSFSQAAAEAGRSRIYGGIHYEFSNQDGQSLGRAVADEVLERFSLADDLLAPSIVFLSPTANMVTSTNPTIEGWVIDNLSGIASATVQVDGGAIQPLSVNANGRFTFTPSLPLNNTANGSHTVRFAATDKAGLRSSSFDFSFTLDTLTPTASITSPAEGATITAAQLLEGTVSGTGSNLVSLTYQIGNGSRIPISVPSTSGSFSSSIDLSKLQPGSHTLKLTVRDAAGLETIVNRSFTISQRIPLTITDQSPANGSSDIGSTFRPQVNFSRPVNKSTLTPASFYATDTTGAKLPATIVPSQDGSFAWLFFTSPMPGSSTITVHVDGDVITGLDGALLDADGDGTAGGKFSYSFSTVSLASLPNTSIKGRVVDPGVDLKPMTRDDILAGPDGVLHTSDDVFLNPIAGAKVFILGRESQFVTTDANGLFELNSVPSGTIKLAIDGRTASNAPTGIFFPEMVMDLELDAGYTNTVMGSMGTREERAANLDRTEVYLPRIQSSVLTTASSTTTTTVGVTGTSAPNLTETQRSNLKLEVVPGSIVGEDGKPLSNPTIGISTVPPELVRDMLPPGLLQHTFDITIQAPGAATFNTPLQMTFPNVFNAAPGTQLSFLSFDHTTGRLVIEGTATVSADGLSATTDAGSGITKPGWHGVTPPGGTAEPPCNPNAPKTTEVSPIPFASGIEDTFLSGEKRSIKLLFRNDAKPLSPAENACSLENSKATSLIVRITVTGAADEFLDGISSHSFQLSPGDKPSELTVTLKDIAKQLPKIVRDRIYGATVKVEYFSSSDPSKLLQPAKTMNIYAFADAADDSPMNGKAGFPDTIVDSLIDSRDSTLDEIRSTLSEVRVKSVTVVTHGFQALSSMGDSLMPLARAIYEKKQDTNSGHAWLLDYDLSNENTKGTFDKRQSILPQSSERIQRIEGDLVLLFDWSPESNELSGGWTEAAGDALYSMLRGLGLFEQNDTSGPRLPPDLHFIGHSFGAAVTSEAVRRVLAAGIPVGHVTYLDPHDFDQPLLAVDGSQGQSLISGGIPGYGANAWAGVGFTDVYYETRGLNSGVLPDLVVPRGRPIPGAYNVLLDDELPTPSDMIVSLEISGDHSYVWSSFYMATITGRLPSDAMPPARSTSYLNTGYQFQSNRSLTRPKPNFGTIDVSGVSEAFPNGHLLISGRSVAHSTVIEIPIVVGPQIIFVPTTHLLSDSRLVGIDGVLKPGVVGSINSRPTPTYEPLSIFNGGFDIDPNNWTSNMVPGWSNHGGGGTGDVDTTSTNGYLQLNFGDSTRTHNWLYFPPDAASFSSS